MSESAPEEMLAGAAANVSRAAHLNAMVPPPPRPTRRAVTGAVIDPEAWSTRTFLAVATVLGRDHRHRVVHLERLRRLFRSGRRVILVGNHALDIVDPLLLLATVFRQLHRVPRFIGHENGWFRVPVLRDISAQFQVIPSRQPEEAVAALRRDGFLMLYPGAIREGGMRSYREEPYRLKWEGRTGFVRLAVVAQHVVHPGPPGAQGSYPYGPQPTGGTPSAGAS